MHIHILGICGYRFLDRSARSESALARQGERLRLLPPTPPIAQRALS